MAADTKLISFNKKCNTNILMSLSDFNIIFSVVLCCFVLSVTGQTTRDPRFYSRPGVHDYFPQDPGDPDYR